MTTHYYIRVGEMECKVQSSQMPSVDELLQLHQDGKLVLRNKMSVMVVAVEVESFTERRRMAATNSGWSDVTLFRRLSEQTVKTATFRYSKNKGYWLE